MDTSATSYTLPVTYDPPGGLLPIMETDASPPSRKGVLVHLGITFGIGIALFIIVNVLGSQGVFTGNTGSLIVGGTLLGGSILSFAVYERFFVKNQLVVTDDQRYAQLCRIVTLIAVCACATLGVTGSFSANWVANASMIASGGVGALMMLFKQIKEGDKTQIVSLTLFLALVIISALGITNVFNGENGSLIMGSLALSVTLLQVTLTYYSAKRAREEASKNKQPDPTHPDLNKFLLLTVITNVVLGALGISGTLSSSSLGTALLISQTGIGLGFDMAGGWRMTPPDETAVSGMSKTPVSASDLP